MNELSRLQDRPHGTLFLPIFMNNRILNYSKHNLNRFYFQSRFYVNFLLFCTRCNAPLVTSGVSGALEIPLCICICIYLRLLSFYVILYRSMLANPLNVCITDSADVSLQFHQHVIRSSYGLSANFTVCFIADCRAILVHVVRIDSGMFRSWQPLLWPSVSRRFGRRPAGTARAVLLVSLLLLSGDVQLNPGAITNVNTPNSINIGALNCFSASGKIALIHNVIADYDVDFLALSETWFTTDTPSSIIVSK